MSGVFPTTPKPNRLKISSLSPTMVSVTQNLKKQRRSRGGQRWAIELGWAELKRAEFAPIFAFSIKQRGRYETFTITLPEFSTAQGAASGVPLVNGAGQTGHILFTKGWSINTTDIMKAGDYFKINNDNKVYMVVENVSSDGGGNAVLTIEPALMIAPSHYASLQVTNIDFRVIFNEDIVETETILSSPIRYSYVVSLIETV